LDQRPRPTQVSHQCQSRSQVLGHTWRKETSHQPKRNLKSQRDHLALAVSELLNQRLRRKSRSSLLQASAASEGLEESATSAGWVLPTHLEEANQLLGASEDSHQRLLNSPNSSARFQLPRLPPSRRTTRTRHQPKSSARVSSANQDNCR